MQTTKPVETITVHVESFQFHAQPGRYSHVAVRPVKEYKVWRDGKLWINVPSKSQVTSLLRSDARKRGVRVEIKFEAAA